ncbi:MAG: hypothetical protein JWN69_681 [Alphaproteobacteria bacterium]|nr:hypothetical protein [Alphaproteobacteria bacterium]
MWGDTEPSGFTYLAIVASVVAGALGFLPRSYLRSILIWAWVLVPLIFSLVYTRSFDELGIGIAFGVTLLIPWAGIAVLSYNLVRRFREIHLGID